MRIIIDPKHDLQKNKEGVSIQIKGYSGNPECEPENDEHVYIEKYDGKVRIIVWDGSPNAQTFVVNLYPQKD